MSSPGKTLPRVVGGEGGECGTRHLLAQSSGPARSGRATWWPLGKAQPGLTTSPEPTGPREPRDRGRVRKGSSISSSTPRPSSHDLILGRLAWTSCPSSGSAHSRSSYSPRGLGLPRGTPLPPLPPPPHLFGCVILNKSFTGPDLQFLRILKVGEGTNNTACRAGGPLNGTTNTAAG